MSSNDIIDVVATEVTDTPKIDGYRTLTPDEIAQINKIKTLGGLIQEMVEAIATMESAKCTTQSSEAELSAATEAMRWTSIAKTHLQQGLMCLTRAVAKPENF